MTDATNGQDIFVHPRLGGCHIWYRSVSAADYCRQLRSEVRELDLEATKLRDEIHVLSTEIK